MQPLLPYARKHIIKTVIDNFFKKLQEQNYRCAYSLVPLTIVPSFARFSFERINNAMPHFTLEGELTNIVLTCRLFNSRRQMSRAKLLAYYLTQELVYVPIEARKCAEDELAANTNLIDCG
jgi:hypothetical protein